MGFETEMSLRMHVNDGKAINDPGLVGVGAVSAVSATRAASY